MFFYKILTWLILWYIYVISRHYLTSLIYKSSFDNTDIKNIDYLIMLFDNVEKDNVYFESLFLLLLTAFHQLMSHS